MYIVSGANGQTGSVVAKTLLEKGLPVRVIVRSEEKGKSFKDSGARCGIRLLSTRHPIRSSALPRCKGLEQNFD